MPTPRPWVRGDRLRRRCVGGRAAAVLLVAAMAAAGCTSAPVVTPSLQPVATVASPRATGSVVPWEAPASSPTASPTPTSPALDGPLATLAGLSGALQAQLASAVRSLHLPGVQATILLADGESWSGAAGMADQAARRPMTTADVFDVGSITKTFVAADILRLAEAGTIGLDDSLSRWVPRFPDAAHITLRELLSHTSGVADYFDNEHLLIALGARPTASWAPAALLRYVGKVHFPPGKGWSYSNTNYLLLGEVIGAATGRTVAAELQARFLAPHGLVSTALQAGAVVAPAPSLGPLALPYERGPGTKVVFRPLADGSGYLPFTSLATALGAAGSLVSTSADLASWGADLYGGAVLGPASLAAMEDTSISAPFHPAFIYGLGAQKLVIDTFTTYGHGGACSGYRAVLRYVPALGASIAVLTNIDGPDPDRVVAQLLAVLIAPRGGPTRV